MSALRLLSLVAADAHTLAARLPAAADVLAATQRSRSSAKPLLEFRSLLPPSTPLQVKRPPAKRWLTWIVPGVVGSIGARRESFGAVSGSPALSAP